MNVQGTVLWMVTESGMEQPGKMGQKTANVSMEKLFAPARN